MSYKNMVPRVWAKGIQHDLEKKFIYATDCNRQYEGDVSNLGDTIKILGVGKPTVTVQEGGKIVLPSAEEVDTSSVSMPINHVAYFNYTVGDIDKLQAVDGIMEALAKEANNGISDKMDQYIADLAKDKLAQKYNTSALQITKSNVLETLDEVQTELYKENVKTSDFVVVNCSPTFYKFFKQAYISSDTNNSEMLENGKVGMYSHMTLRMSNNVATDSSGNEYIMVRTNKAIAFANPKIHIEPYRPQEAFEDAVKGYSLFDAKIVRPKELYVIKVKYTA